MRSRLRNESRSNACYRKTAAAIRRGSRVEGAEERRSPVLRNIEEGAWVYFVHSFYVAPSREEDAATLTEYDGEFVSSVWRDNLFATQFHPEKSQKTGLHMLKNFVEYGRKD